MLTKEDFCTCEWCEKSILIDDSDNLGDERVCYSCLEEAGLEQCDFCSEYKNSIEEFLILIGEPEGQRICLTCYKDMDIPLAYEPIGNAVAQLAVRLASA